jgi:hypothetical protein
MRSVTLEIHGVAAAGASQSQTAATDLNHLGDQLKTLVGQYRL